MGFTTNAQIQNLGWCKVQYWNNPLLYLGLKEFKIVAHNFGPGETPSRHSPAQRTTYLRIANNGEIPTQLQFQLEPKRNWKQPGNYIN